MDTMWKRFFVVLAGLFTYLALWALSYAASSLLIYRFDPDQWARVSNDVQRFVGFNWLLLLVLGEVLAGFASGFLTGRLAPFEPYRHAQVLAILLLMGSVFALLDFHEDQAIAPLWLPLLRMLLAPAAALLGGRLAAQQLQLRQDELLKPAE